MDRLGPYLLGPNDENQGIYTGDARELAEAIPDESVDLIYTDPPYPKEFLSLYGWMAEEAARILKPGGSLFTFAGHAYLPTVMNMLTRHLNYHWINCHYQPTVTRTATFWPRMVFIRWKPVLWFVKGEYKNRFIIQDGVSPQAADKRYHKWGQPTSGSIYWLYEMGTRIDTEAIVFDPFCGGGTTPAVCKQIFLRWIAFEILAETADDARKRVRETQPPLFVPEPQQMEFAV